MVEWPWTIHGGNQPPSRGPCAVCAHRELTHGRPSICRRAGRQRWCAWGWSGCGASPRGHRPPPQRLTPRQERQAEAPGGGGSTHHPPPPLMAPPCQTTLTVRATGGQRWRTCRWGRFGRQTLYMREAQPRARRQLLPAAWNEASPPTPPPSRPPQQLQTKETNEPNRVRRESSLPTSACRVDGRKKRRKKKVDDGKSGWPTKSAADSRGRCGAETPAHAALGRAYNATQEGEAHRKRQGKERPHGSSTQCSSIHNTNQSASVEVKVDSVSASAHHRCPQLLAAAAAVARLYPIVVSVVHTAQRLGAPPPPGGTGSPPYQPTPAHGSAPTPSHQMHSHQHTSS